VAAFNRILISRTDAIGDVILTLPMVALIKRHHPDAKIIFLGRAYTKDIIAASGFVDEFVDVALLDQTRLEALKLDVFLHVFPRKELADLAKNAGIPKRIGTLSRTYHWLTCTDRVWLKRQSSDLHEAQLNIQLAVKGGLLPKEALTENLQTLDLGLAVTPFWPSDLEGLRGAKRKKWILHPGSNESARNWPLENFVTLAEKLNQKGELVYLTGTENEGLVFRAAFDKRLKSGMTFDLSGKLSLTELWGFIKSVDGLIAASTGPLHMAASLGKEAIGLYPPKRPMHPGRWAPIGPGALALTCGAYPKVNCRRCDRTPQTCACMADINPSMVLQKISEQNLKRV